MNFFRSKLIWSSRAFAGSGCTVRPKHLAFLSTVTASDLTFSTKEPKSHYDAVVIGAGHNGLIAAAYLAKAGLEVCVVERRHLIGGATVTEEIIPGFKFSRASYLLSLLRPQIIKDLELKKYGLKIFLRDPSSYTPLAVPGGFSGKAQSLLLGRNVAKNQQQIAQFSKRDAEMFTKYEALLEKIVDALQPMLDSPPLTTSFVGSSISDKLNNLPALRALFSAVQSVGKDFPSFYKLMTAPASKILNGWFDSEPLKATLATDAVIGSMTSPYLPGSGYVLLHHVMGELEGVKGIWGYVEGGMGSVAQAIARCAVDHGVSIFVNKTVQKMIVENNQGKGVKLLDGTEIRAKVILSNATPKITYLDLMPEDSLPESVVTEVQQFDFTSPVTKINVAVSRLPNFLADPNLHPNEAMPHHQATIHLNCENMDLIHSAYLDAQAGLYSQKPMIEMVIPSSLDSTLAPPGCHVVLIFTQYTPYTLAGGNQWTDEQRNHYANLVFETIEQYAPGFRESVIGRDILTPPDLENIIGLTGGNIFHGTMSLDQLYLGRPSPSLSNYRCPVAGIYLCGSGSHPGGGVLGSPGRLAAQAVLSDFKKL